jgi:hypothetical protein
MLELSWEPQKNIQTFTKWIHCLLVWQWFKGMQNMQMRSNEQENKRPRKSETHRKAHVSCAIRDPTSFVLVLVKNMVETDL